MTLEHLCERILKFELIFASLSALKLLKKTKKPSALTLMIVDLVNNRSFVTDTNAGR